MKFPLIPSRAPIAEKDTLSIARPWLQWISSVVRIVEPSTGELPETGDYVGQYHWNTPAGRPVFWNGSSWVSFEGTPTTPSPAPTPTPSPTPGGTLPAGFTSGEVGPMTFEETFSAALDSNKWRLELGYQEGQPGFNGNDYEVSGGLLKIWNTIYQGSTWNEGRVINTDGPGNQFGNASGADTFRFGQKYGIFECECRIPTGRSNWPAFWLYAHDGTQRPEIDIMEYFGGDVNYNSGGTTPFNYAGTYHDGADGATSIQGSKKLVADGGITGQDLSAGFHKYSVKWTSAGIWWYYDGQLIGSIGSAPDEFLFILISMGTQQGHTYNGADYAEPNNTTSQSAANAFEVNYIRVWGLPDNSHATTGTYSP